MCSKSLLCGPVEKRPDGVDAGPFQQSHHETGGQYVRHFAKHGRLRIKMGYGLGGRYRELECVLKTGFERGFHECAGKGMIKGRTGILYLCRMRPRRASMPTIRRKQQRRQLRRAGKEAPAYGFFLRSPLTGGATLS